MPVRTLLGKAVAVPTLLLLMVLVARTTNCYAQSQSVPDAEVKVAVVDPTTQTAPANSGEEKAASGKVSAGVDISSRADTKAEEQNLPVSLEELEAMKARIEQLERQLKDRHDADTAAATARALNRAKELETATPAQQAALTSAVFHPGAAVAPSGAGAGAIAQGTGAPATKEKIAPFSDWDWTWLNGNPRNKDSAFDSKFFTPEIRADITYAYSFNKPKDDSMGGSSELFRSNEIQVEQLGIGGDFHWDNVRARFMTQFGTYSTATVRNDPSPAKGQWNLGDANRYLSEAYGGYHINTLYGINVDAGIFMSYIGLFSYYNFDNWAYQPSYVSSNTPWFFQGVRIQIFPTAHLKIEPWIINGWQSYGSSNSRKGLGGQIKWTPYPWLNIISNNYGLGHDDLYLPNRGRLHTDNSVEVKYYDHPERLYDKGAFSFTGDLGCEFGNGVSCHGNTAGGPKQSFIGYMIYNRAWFKKDLYGLTIGGGQINNPGRYLVLLPPINGMTAASAAINSPYFTENPGDPFKAWDTSVTFDYMPKQWITFRTEYDYRHASVPYWSGHGGVTPPAFLGAPVGTNNGFPTQYACYDGSPSPTINGCGPATGGTWFPDLRRDEQLIDADILVKF
jgi:Putative beta-barrel porin-2, OmpL-like. bbp2